MSVNYDKNIDGGLKSDVNNVRTKICTTAGKFFRKEERRGGCIELDEGEMG